MKKNSIMTKDEYQKKMSECIEAISHYEKEATKISKAVLGKNMIDKDFPYLGFLDRSIHLARGFILMLENRNLSCCGAILRLSIDNCLRLYAINIADDRENVVNTILSGGKIGNLKDKNGNKMTDAYLNKQLEQQDPLISGVYKEASGFIHFSNKAVYQSLLKCDDTGHIEFQIGSDLPDKFNETLIECAFAYMHFYRMFLSMMCSVAELKKEFDKENLTF